MDTKLDSDSTYAFADAVLLDIQALFVIQPNAHVMLEHRRDVMGTARVNGKAVGQGVKGGGFGHGDVFFS
jgi:hypothetical protein